MNWPNSPDGRTCATWWPCCWSVAGYSAWRKTIAARAGEVLVLHCPRRDATYEVPVVIPDPARIDEIQQHVAKLLE